MDKKKLRNDIILIASLLIVAIISLVLDLSSRSSKNSNYAKVYVQDELVLTIDLTKKEEKTYTVHGLNGDLTIQTKDGAIAVTSSNCPHQDCVHMGYVNVTNKPIICAYNAVYIVIEGSLEDYEIVI